MEKVRVWRAEHHEGSCQGCGSNLHVHAILANSCISRFCWDCLKDIMKQAGMDKRDLKAS